MRTLLVVLLLSGCSCPTEIEGPAAAPDAGPVDAGAGGCPPDTCIIDGLTGEEVCICDAPGPTP